MKKNQVARLLAYVTGMVNQRLLLQNEYLIGENRILRSHLPARVRWLWCKLYRACDPHPEMIERASGGENSRPNLWSSSGSAR